MDLDVTQVGLGYLGGTWLLRTWILKWNLFIGLKVEPSIVPSTVLKDLSIVLSTVLKDLSIVLSTVLKDLSNALKLKEPYC